MVDWSIGESILRARFAVDVGVLPQFGGDADEAGEESACQYCGCVVRGVCGVALDNEGVAVVCIGERLEPCRQRFIMAVDGVPNVGEPIGVGVIWGRFVRGWKPATAAPAFRAVSSTERVRAPEQWMT